MTHDTQLALASVLALFAEQHLEVLDVRYEVMWPDTSTLALHPVRQRGANSPLLWAYHQRAGNTPGQWTAFSLAHVAPRVAEDIQRADNRDCPGLLIYGLRRTFVGADAFRAKVYRHELASWPGEGRGPSVRPTGTGRIPTTAGA